MSVLCCADDGCEIVVAFDAPHRILAIKADASSVLGYGEEQLCGRTCQVFQGPRTDSAKLSSAIKGTALQVSTSMYIELYEFFGKSQQMMVICSPYFDLSGRLVGCSLSIRHSP